MSQTSSPARPGRLAWPTGRARIVTIVAILGVVASVVQTLRDPAELVEVWPTLAAFAVAIAIGEYYRFYTEQGRPLAPMSLASGLGLALTEVSGGTDLSRVLPAQIGLVALLAMIVGGTPHVLAGRGVQGGDLAARFLGVSITGLLFRFPQIWHDHSPAAWAASGPTARWQVAVVMAAVSAIGLLSYLASSAILTATKEHRDFLPTLSDQVRSEAGLTLALSATGTLIALAARPLGVAAIPLFMLPIAMTQFAMRQHAGIRRTFRQTIRVLSRVTEVGGFTRAGHPERVAALAVDIGRDLGLTDRETRELEYAALLHDIGQIGLRAPIPGGATVLAAPGDQQQIALGGARIVSKTGVGPVVADAVRAQATQFRVVREEGLELSMLARIVKVANAYDDLVGGSISPRRQAAAVERIQLGLGYEYDPRVVDSLVRVVGRRQAARTGS